MNKLTVAVIGCGRFAQFFVPLFKAHPFVEKVYVCDLIREKAEEFRDRFEVEIIDTYEDALASSEINCIANFTQRHLHGDIVVRALKAGKHLYSAVPMATSVEECQEIVELVKKTGKIYMMGETCYYYPCAMFCREAHKEGKFGTFAHGDSQYFHDIDAIGYGKTPNEAGMPPLFYPTHSTGMILSATGTYAKKVVCLGYKDTVNDGRFGKGTNEWGNEFSNQYVLMELSNGGIARVTEARRIGYKSPSSYISGFYGVDGSYEFSNAQHILIQRTSKPGEPEKMNLTDVSDYVNPKTMTENKDDPEFKIKAANHKWQWSSFAPIQQKEVDRLPKEFEGLPNGHMGSHQFLIDDFCKAVYNNEQPILNAWTSARYTIPGLVAIESAKQGGMPMDVPDCGEPPTNKVK